MRTRTVTVREGELLGPIDWGYDFDSHAWNKGGGACNPEIVKRGREHLKTLEEMLKANTPAQVMQYGTWQDVAEIGMYDGWPFWRPVPSYATRVVVGMCGIEWHSFCCIQDVRLTPDPTER